jgi:hypothetical protein
MRYLFYNLLGDLMELPPTIPSDIDVEKGFLKVKELGWKTIFHIRNIGFGKLYLFKKKIYSTIMNRPNKLFYFMFIRSIFFWFCCKFVCMRDQTRSNDKFFLNIELNLI